MRRGATPRRRRRDLYASTGMQFLPFNTIYQLVAPAARRWHAAATLLLIPDLIGYWLTGLERRRGDQRLHHRAARRPHRAAGPPSCSPRSASRRAAAAAASRPGDVVGRCSADVAPRPGLDRRPPVIAVGSHDTASAVAAVPADGDALRLHLLRHLVAGRRRARRAGADRGEPAGQLHQRARRRRPHPLPAQRHGPVAAAGVAAHLGARRGDAADLRRAAREAAARPAARPGRRPRRPLVPRRRATCRHGSPRPAAARGPAVPQTPGRDRPVHPGQPRAAFAAHGRRRRAPLRPHGRGRPHRRRRVPNSCCASSPPTPAAGRWWPGRWRRPRWATCWCRRARRRGRPATWTRCGRWCARTQRGPPLPAGHGGGLTMRIALFVTCLADALFPDGGQGDRAAAGAARPRGRVPAGADLLRADARQHRLPARGAAAGAPARRRRSTAVRRGGRAVRVVRRARSGTSTRWWPARPATSALAAAADDVAAQTYELSEFLVDVLGVDRRRRVLPAPGHLPPDLPLAADAAGRRQAAAAAARGARARPGRAARGRAVLRLRRHVRAEERRHLDGDARRQDAPRAATPAPRCCTAGDTPA